MITLPTSVAIIILLWIFWPRIRQWQYDRKLMRNHRRWTKTHIPMPRYYDTVSQWEEYFNKHSNPYVGLLRIEMARCVDDTGVPLPEYQSVYDLIYRYIVDSGYKLQFNRHRHSFELNPL